jgi:phenylacetate-CoA ligase
LTTLTTRAFPLIRFRTGDRVRMLPGLCPCGRTLGRMEWSPHRTDETMVIRGVKIHHHHLLLLLERILGAIPGAYRFFIRQQDQRDYLEVWLKVDGELFSDQVKEMEKLSQRVASELSQELGVPVRIRFKEEGSFAPATLSYRIEDMR